MLKMSFCKKVRNEDLSFELFLAASSMTPFKPQSSLLKVCAGLAAMAPFAGLVLVEGCEGGSGFNPGLWRSCLPRMVWRL